MVGPGGLEPPTPALSTRCSNQLSYGPNVSSPPIGGADRDRTDDLLNANQALFQLSYGPPYMVGSNRPFNELMEVKNYGVVLQKLFCVI